MRAAQVVSLDGPVGVRIVDVPEPRPEGDDVVVDVYAAAVGFPDLLLSQGRYQLKPELPFTLGIDFAGIVRAAPHGSRFAAGDRVAGWRPVGADAEVVAADPQNLFHLPESVSLAHGACLPLNYLTAHFALSTRAGLQPGEVVLVHGATGGLGSAIVQIAKAYGARVIGVVSTEDRIAIARELGADEVVLAEGFREGVRELCGQRGVNIVADVVGREDLVLDSLRLLAIRGRLLVLGFAGGEIPSIALNRLLLTNVDVRGVSWGAYTRAHPGYVQTQWDTLREHLRSGAITPLIGTQYPLAEVSRALADLAERRAVGKSVLLLR